MDRAATVVEYMSQWKGVMLGRFSFRGPNCIPSKRIKGNSQDWDWYSSPGLSDLVGGELV